jgi:hypothetical protein
MATASRNICTAREMPLTSRLVIPFDFLGLMGIFPGTAFPISGEDGQRNYIKQENNRPLLYGPILAQKPIHRLIWPNPWQ